MAGEYDTIFHIHISLPVRERGNNKRSQWLYACFAAQSYPQTRVQLQATQSSTFMAILINQNEYRKTDHCTLYRSLRIILRYLVMATAPYARHDVEEKLNSLVLAFSYLSFGATTTTGQPSFARHSLRVHTADLSSPAVVLSNLRVSQTTNRHQCDRLPRFAR